MQPIKMLPKDQFAALPGIRKLAQQPYWSISGDYHDSTRTTKGDKIAINWQYYQQTHQFKLYDLKHRDAQGNYTSLTTLDQINADPHFDYTNRTYRLNASQSRIFMLDIEKNASRYAMQQLTQIPTIYTEISQHGGWHALIEVPPDLAERYHDILAATAIKGSADSHRPYDDPDNVPQFECLFNHHFITFTRFYQSYAQVYPQFKPTPSNARKQRQILIQFLDYLTDNHLTDPEVDETPMTFAHNLQTPLLKVKQLVNLAEQTRQGKPLEHIFQYRLADTRPRANDRSSYESKIMYHLEYFLLRESYHTQPFNHDTNYSLLMPQHQSTALLYPDVPLIEMPQRHAFLKQCEPCDYLQASVILAMHAHEFMAQRHLTTDLQPRPKWKRYLQGKPWLLYVACSAYRIDVATQVHYDCTHLGRNPRAERQAAYAKLKQQHHSSD